MNRRIRQVFLINIFIICLVFAVLLYVNYKLIMQKIDDEVEENLIKTHSILESNLSYTGNLLLSMGKEISNHDNFDDLNFIYNLFVRSAQIQNSEDNILSWSMFDWVNNKNEQTVNTMIGITRVNPKNMMIRNYTKEARLDPWQLKFLAPAIGYPSQSYIMPVGLGVVNKNGGYEGLIAIGISIKKLTNKINSVLSHGYYFIIIDLADKNYVASSFDRTSDHRYYENNKEALNNIDSNGMLKKPIKLNKIIFTKSIKLDNNYPYAILIGYSESKVKAEIYSLFLNGIIFLILFVILNNLILINFIRSAKSKK